MYLHELTHQLKAISESPNLDAQVLMAHILEQPRSWVIAHPENKLNTAQAKTLEKALEKLQAGIPLPYVIGHWEFFGLDFIVTPDVLIPRPETEELVEYALDWLHDKKDLRALDMGTGSGCIPISLARNAPDLSLVAVDRSSAALEIARQNAEKYGVVDQIDFIESDLFSNLQMTKFDLITANLPYIPTAILHTLDVYTSEPTIALDGGADGLEIIRSFLAEAPKYLALNGLMLLEIDETHGRKALDVAREIFPTADCGLLQDLSERDRFIRIQI